MARIQTAKDARSRIGEKVWWDDHSSRYVFLKCGIINGVEGRHVLIDHNWYTVGNLRELRTTESGGAFK